MVPIPPYASLLPVLMTPEAIRHDRQSSSSSKDPVTAFKDVLLELEQKYEKALIQQPFKLAHTIDFDDFLSIVKANLPEPAQESVLFWLNFIKANVAAPSTSLSKSNTLNMPIETVMACVLADFNKSDHHRFTQYMRNATQYLIQELTQTSGKSSSQYHLDQANKLHRQVCTINSALLTFPAIERPFPHESEQRQKAWLHKQMLIMCLQFSADFYQELADIHKQKAGVLNHPSLSTTHSHLVVGASSLASEHTAIPLRTSEHKKKSSSFFSLLSNKLQNISSSLPNLKKAANNTKEEQTRRHSEPIGDTDDTAATQTSSTDRAVLAKTHMQHDVKTKSNKKTSPRPVIIIKISEEHVYTKTDVLEDPETKITHTTEVKPIEKGDSSDSDSDSRSDSSHTLKPISLLKLESSIDTAATDKGNVSTQSKVQARKLLQKVKGVRGVTIRKSIPIFTKTPSPTVTATTSVTSTDLPMKTEAKMAQQAKLRPMEKDVSSDSDSDSSILSQKLEQTLERARKIRNRKANFEPKHDGQAQHQGRDQSPLASTASGSAASAGIVGSTNSATGVKQEASLPRSPKVIMLKRGIAQLKNKTKPALRPKNKDDASLSKNSPTSKERKSPTPVPPIELSTKF